MDITLILCTCDRSACIKRLLESISSFSFVPNQIVIVDASDDNNTRCIVEQMDNLNLEYYHTERGLAIQRNFGLSKARCEVVGFFDDDIIPDDNFFALLYDIFESMPEVYGVVPYVYESDNSERHDFKGYLMRFFEMLCGKSFFVKICRKNNFNNRLTNEIVDNVLANGCSFYRRAVFGKYKFAQWMYGYCYGEDIEFGLRVASEFKIIGAGALRVHHYHEPAGRNNDFQVTQMKIYNFVRIIDSHGSGNRFVVKIALTFRLMLSCLLGVILSLLKLRVVKASQQLGGILFGLARIIPLCFKNTLYAR